MSSSSSWAAIKRGGEGTAAQRRNGDGDHPRLLLQHDDADGDDDIDNEQDYDRLLAPVKPPPPSSLRGEEGDIAMVAADSFVSTQDSASDTVVDYAVDEDEFHKIRLLHCDFLIRKVPDPDDDVYDFREVGPLPR